jgi:hypothetical protein
MAIFMPPPWRRPRGNQAPAFLRQAKRPPSPEGSTAFCKPVLAPGTGPPNYCGGGGGGGLREFGFTERMKAMILHKSSLLLMISPKGGMGPTIVSVLTRV